MKQNKDLERKLIDLSHHTEHNTVIPLIIEYTEINLECMKLKGVDSQKASEHAYNILKTKYETKQEVKSIDVFDDVNIINPNIQERY